jgi:hypothetical protein
MKRLKKKLAALLLSEIPDSSFEVHEQDGNYIKKIIKINYAARHKLDVFKVVTDFINKKALANLYYYNKSLNRIRDRLRGLEDGKAGNRN